MFHAILRMYICLSDIKFNWAFYISTGNQALLGLQEKLLTSLATLPQTHITQGPFQSDPYIRWRNSLVNKSHSYDDGSQTGSHDLKRGINEAPLYLVGKTPQCLEPVSSNSQDALREHNRHPFPQY